MLLTVNFSLKRKDSRLRDWNVAFSSDRSRRITWKEKILDYEIETFGSGSFSKSCLNLKRKDSRLRDWNKMRLIAATRWRSLTWKEKILDYEIETTRVFKKTSLIALLEKKRFSITRLKQSGLLPLVLDMFLLKRKDSRLRDWNWSINLFRSRDLTGLEKKRFSITRLKRDFSDPFFVLFYVLEKKRFSITRLKRSAIYRAVVADHCETWKEKILDYEIETNICLPAVAGTRCSNLKRKDSRLRDWNEGVLPERTRISGWRLEKKRFSITRLKQV